MGYTPGALPIGSVIYLNTSIKLSEHNRQPVSITPNRIEKSTRMTNGTLRKFYIDDKYKSKDFSDLIKNTSITEAVNILTRDMMLPF